MKKFILPILAIIILIVFIIQHRKLERFKTTSQLQAVELSTIKDSVKVIKRKNGELSYQVQSSEVDKRNLKEALEIAGYDIKKLKESEIRYRKLNSILKAQLEAKDSGQTVIRDTLLIVENDTIKAGSFQVNNHFLLFNGLIKRDSLNWDYRYNVEFDFFHETNKNKTVVTVALNDPKAEIISMNSITISHKRRWYEKPWVWGAAGIATGILISK